MAASGAGASLFLMDTQQTGQAEERARQGMAFKQAVGLALALPADVVSPDRIVAAFPDFLQYVLLQHFI